MKHGVRMDKTTDAFCARKNGIPARKFSQL